MKRIYTNRMRKFGILFSFLLFSMLYSNLFAHDMYMWPKMDQKNSSRVSLGMLVEKEKVLWFDSMTAGLRMDGPSGEAELRVPDEGNPIVEFNRGGTYVIGWQSEPFFLQVDPEIFKKYIALEGYTVAAGLGDKLNNKPGREIYTRYIKTFIQIGPTATEDYNRPFGYKIEMIPLQNPCSLNVNSDLDVQVLYQGKPLPNHRVMATYDSYSDLPEDYAQVTKTDQDGIARFRITKKGLWLIRTNQMIRLDDHSEADWQSFWANFTFEVR